MARESRPRRLVGYCDIGIRVKSLLGAIDPPERRRAI
jgi:hypothetical protein